MILRGFTIWDDKARTHSAPYWFPTRGMALRTFGDLASDGKSELAKHAEDYKFFEVAEFDMETGLLKEGLHPVHIGDALQLRIVED